MLFFVYQGNSIARPIWIRGSYRDKILVPELDRVESFPEVEPIQAGD